MLSYSLLVTRVSPFADASGDRPPRHAYLPRKLHFRGVRGRWAFIRPMRRIIMILSTLWRWALNHPAPLGHPSAEGNLDRDGTGGAAPSVVKGTLGCDGNVPSSPPLEGWRLAAGVVRDCGIRYLIPLSFPRRRE